MHQTHFFIPDAHPLAPNVPALSSVLAGVYVALDPTASFPSINLSSVAAALMIDSQQQHQSSADAADSVVKKEDARVEEADSSSERNLFLSDPDHIVTETARACAALLIAMGAIVRSTFSPSKCNLFVASSTKDNGFAEVCMYVVHFDLSCHMTPIVGLLCWLSVCQRSLDSPMSCCLHSVSHL